MASTSNPKSKIQNPKSLVLTAPTSNIAYEIHPGVPRERQHVEVAGYSADGRPWAELRLVKDGVVLAQADNATRISTWWVFEPGQHHFWLEGTPTTGGAISRSDTALVVIENFTLQPLEVSTNSNLP